MLFFFIITVCEQIFKEMISVLYVLSFSFSSPALVLTTGHRLYKAWGSSLSIHWEWSRWSAWAHAAISCILSLSFPCFWIQTHTADKPGVVSVPCLFLLRLAETRGAQPIRRTCTFYQFQHLLWAFLSPCKNEAEYHSWKVGCILPTLFCG